MTQCGPPTLAPCAVYTCATPLTCGVCASQVLSMSATLDDVNKTIAELWADGPDSTTPPGHW